MGGILETQELFPIAYYTHKPMYASLNLFTGLWNMLNDWDSDLFWFSNGRIWGVFFRCVPRLAIFFIAPKNCIF